jgi:leader peptidase (prepilin peptidase)/N-methyltransferase
VPLDLLPADLRLLALVATGVLGASLGSFLNVCIARWPVEASVVRPRSRCPRCARGIAWQENIPVLSWLLLGGKCRGCRLPISLQYPAVELLVAAGWMACLWAFGAGLEAVRVAVFGTLLLGVAITDARHYLIPDGYTVTGLLVGGGGAVAQLFTDEATRFAGPWDAVLGACVGAGAITIIGWLAEVVLKREAMGFGDSTLMAMVGAALGPERALLTIFAGAFVGAVAFLLVVAPVGWLRARRRGEAFAFPEVPFGVFLAPAALLVLLWGTPLITWYLTRTFPEPV